MPQWERELQVIQHCWSVKEKKGNGERGDFKFIFWKHYWQRCRRWNVGQRKRLREEKLESEASSFLSLSIIC